MEGAHKTDQLEKLLVNQIIARVESLGSKSKIFGAS